MKIFSPLLDVCEGNSPVTDGFPSQQTSNTGFSCFLNYRQWTVYSHKKSVMWRYHVFSIEQNVEPPAWSVVIWDAMTSLRRHCNRNCLCKACWLHGYSTSACTYWMCRNEVIWYSYPFYEAFPVNGSVVFVAVLKERPSGNRDAITRYEKQTVAKL